MNTVCKEKIGKERIRWVDMARGYGILLVILGHLSIGDDLHLWIYSFHMPLFFFLSGVLFRADGGIFAFIRKKARNLLIPYLFLGLLLVFWGVLMQTIKSGFRLNYMLGELANFAIQRLWTSAWFLPCLFLTETAYMLLFKAIKNKKVLALLMCFIIIGAHCYYRYVGVILPWNLDRAIAALPFYAAGHFFAAHNLMEKITRTKLRTVLIACGALTVSLLGSVASNKLPGIRVNAGGGFPYGTYIGAFAGLLFVLALASLGSLKCIEFVGVNSLFYFAIHQRIVIGTLTSAFAMLHIFQSGASFFVGQIIMFAASVIFCTLFCVVVKAILRKCKQRKSINQV